MLSGPGPQLLEGSISLKFLVETRLKSKSFEPLIGFLHFLFQSYGKITKIWVKNLFWVIFTQI